MHWLKTVLREILGLFVDEWSFALAILLWLAIVWITLTHLHLHAAAAGIILFAGLALILIESALRFARKRQR